MRQRFVLISLALFMVGCAESVTSSDGAVPSQENRQVSGKVATPDMPELPPLPDSLRLEDIDFTTYSQDLAGGADLTEGQSRIEAIDAVRLYFAPEEGAQIINTAQSTFEREDGAVMLLSASGLPNDSVKAQEFYLIFMGEAGNQTLAVNLFNSLRARKTTP